MDMWGVTYSMGHLQTNTATLVLLTASLVLTSAHRALLLSTGVPADSCLHHLTISNAASGKDAMCLAVVQTKLVMAPCSADVSQRFGVSRSPSSWAWFTVTHEASGLCVDAADNNTLVAQCNGGRTQFWSTDWGGRFVNMGSTPNTVCIDVAGGVISKATQPASLILDTCGSVYLQPTQMWLFLMSNTPIGGFTGMISTMGWPPGHCLDANSTRLSGPIFFTPCQLSYVAGVYGPGKPSQAVAARPYPPNSAGWPSGTFMLQFVSPQNRSATLCLDVLGKQGPGSVRGVLITTVCDIKQPGRQLWHYDQYGQLVNGRKEDGQDASKADCIQVGMPLGDYPNTSTPATVTQCSYDVTLKWMFVFDVIA